MTPADLLVGALMVLAAVSLLALAYVVVVATVTVVRDVRAHPEHYAKKARGDRS